MKYIYDNFEKCYIRVNNKIYDITVIIIMMNLFGKNRHEVAGIKNSDM